MASGIGLAVESLREQLEHVGFRKRAGAIFTLELAAEVTGWLGLNHASRHRPTGQVEVNPVVGVRHQAVEQLIAELREDKSQEYTAPTVSTPIGYVMPEHRYMSWEFGGQHGTVAGSDLIAAIRNYGIPFMRSLTSLPALFDAVNKGFSQCPEYHVPTLLEIMGRHDDAMIAMTRAIQELGDREDPAARQLRHFAVAFERRNYRHRTEGLG